MLLRIVVFARKGIQLPVFLQNYKTRTVTLGYSASHDCIIFRVKWPSSSTPPPHPKEETKILFVQNSCTFCPLPENGNGFGVKREPAVRLTPLPTKALKFSTRASCLPLQRSFPPKTKNRTLFISCSSGSVAYYKMFALCVSCIKKFERFDGRLDESYSFCAQSSARQRDNMTSVALTERKLSYGNKDKCETLSVAFGMGAFY